MLFNISYLYVNYCINLAIVPQAFFFFKLLLHISAAYSFMERKFRTSTISATQSDGGLVSKELKVSVTVN